MSPSSLLSSISHSTASLIQSDSPPAESASDLRDAGQSFRLVNSSLKWVPCDGEEKLKAPSRPPREVPLSPVHVQRTGVRRARYWTCGESRGEHEVDVPIMQVFCTWGYKHRRPGPPPLPTAGVVFPISHSPERACVPSSLHRCIAACLHLRIGRHSSGTCAGPVDLTAGPCHVTEAAPSAICVRC